MNFWADLLPGAKFLFVYRSPWEVVDSLYRRRDAIFQQDPMLAMRYWQHYNTLLLRFAEENPQRSLIVPLNSFVGNSPVLVELIKGKFGMSLLPPSQEPFDSSLMSTAADHRPQLVKLFFPEAFQLWCRLNEASPAKAQQDSYTAFDGAVDLAESFMQDWMSARRAETTLEEVSDTLYSVRCELFDAKTRLNYLERSRLWKVRDKLLVLRRLPRV